MLPEAGSPALQEWRKGCKLKLADWRVDDRERRVGSLQQHDMQRRLQVFAGLAKNFDLEGYAYVGPTTYVRTSETVGRGALQC